MKDIKKVVIEIDCQGSAFEGDPIHEISRILARVPGKVVEQWERPDAISDAPESADKLLDINGSTVGKLTVWREGEEELPLYGAVEIEVKNLVVEVEHKDDGVSVYVHAKNGDREECLTETWCTFSEGGE